MRRTMNRDRDKESKMGVAAHCAAQSAALASALLFAVTSAALAADLPAPAPIPSPAYLPPVYNWTGFYIGGNAGYAWGSQDPLVLFSNRFDRQSFDISGGMIGGTIGAQIQQGYVVLGLEGGD